MTYKERKDYLLYTMIAFLVGAVLYCFMAVILVLDQKLELSTLEKIGTATLMTIFGGYFICSIISGIILFSRFIRKQSKKIKILAVILFFIPVAIVFYFGVLSTLPYFIYNLVQVRKRSLIVEK